jgi:type I restriction enzyme M protein
VVLDKEHANARKGIFMIDASKGFIKDGNKNRLRAQDIHRIVDTFTRQLEVLRYSRMVPLGEISEPKNDFNLNLPRYIDSSEPEDLQDIDAHLRGGIPNRDIDDLDRYWQVFPAVRTAVFKKADRPRYTQLKVPINQVKEAIFSHSEFTTFNESVTALFAKWKKASAPQLRGIAVGGKPKALIEILSEDLLDTFQRAKLVDPYDVYQHLMDYWAEIMQDNVYLLVQEGWKAVLDGKPNTDLIPQPLIVARYFGKGQAAIEKLEADRDAITSEMEEMDEEHGGEDGLLVEAKTEKAKLTKASVKARLAEIAGDKGEADDERRMLVKYSALVEQEAAAGKQVKDAQKALDAQVAAKYRKLTPDEIKTLVVDDKWMARLAGEVESELDRVSQALTRRIRQLAERYATPLPKLTSEVATLAARVGEHLKKMGAVWN